ncbi:glycoside hydrolase family 1 protein [Pectinatus frisingensis]|jgi:6-phospho-beta-glucosidase|uniref:glycoside hydrolase family 1 protein n=1 Tax=Pectinatus frisingensis TaxID=865 RepID=UPI0018C69240|nr:glycoside hydrolase family 1 protein [Pectinatus frisingensis]
MQNKFFWGNSVSSMQTEGGWNEGGKSLSVYDVQKPAKDLSDWHFANDNFHNFAEDFDLMKDAGMNMYRFQISWSRVVKDGTGAWNEAGIEYYDHFIDELIKRGIEPMICLYHFDMPLYLAEKYNGFLSKETVKAFVRFGKEMVKRFSAKCKWWITFNEQNLYSQPDIAFRIAGYVKGDKTTDELYQIMHNVMTAHAQISNFIHETSDAKIGGMLAYSEVYPASCRPKDVECARQWDEFINFSLLDCFAGQGYSPAMLKLVKTKHIDMKMLPEELKDIADLKNDFLSFSYYASTTVDSTNITEETVPNYFLIKGKKVNPYIDSTEWGWQIDPAGFRNVLNKMYQRYRIPVFPIENGIGVREKWDGENIIEDDYRIKYHKEHIDAMLKAINKDGVEVLGYLGWGLIDILSSGGDMEKRYGLVYVNRGNRDLRDMKRVPKKSYFWFKKVIASGGNDM